jgi:hypothetical protein
MLDVVQPSDLRPVTTEFKLRLLWDMVDDALWLRQLWKEQVIRDDGKPDGFASRMMMENNRDLRALIGLDAAHRLDVVQLNAEIAPQPSSTDRIEALINQIVAEHSGAEPEPEPAPTG